ncbi:hypothetical protein COO60DRAFT_361307 [Scenedesmus sp. NREL 46B-D3]|nr:hypothetical protein COO60DRAFT_361307 [Scenedesmus sp. NREL 46B-D3]
MGFRRPRPYLRSVAIPRGIELLLRVRMGCLCVHERTSQCGGRRANSTSGCPCCGAEVESLSHLMFNCPATSAQRDSMFAEIRSLPGCAEKLRSVLSMADSSIKVLRFVSDDIWGSSGRCRMVSPCIAAFLVKLGMCVMHANILEQCSLLFPPRWGAGPMALMLWLEWVI